MSAILELTGLFYAMDLGKKNVTYFEKIYIGYISLEVGKGEAGAILGWVHVSKEELVPTSGLIVGNCPESSCISRIQWHLVVGCFL